MIQKNLSKIKRLVEVKKRGVDVAGQIVSSTRVKQAQKQSEVKSAEQKHRESLERSRLKTGTCVNPQDLELNVGCVRVTNKDVEEANKKLAEVETELEQQTAQLLEVNRELKQMECLFQAKKEEIGREEGIKDQRESDDLVLIKESAK